MVTKYEIEKFREGERTIMRILRDGEGVKARE